MYLIDNAWCRRHEIQIKLSLQTLLHDLQMKQSKETTTESEAQRQRCLRFILQRCIIDLQLLQRIAQIRIFGAVRRIHAAVYHRIDFLITRKRFRTRMCGVRHRITHAGIPHILDARTDIADHAGRQFVTRNELPCSKVTHLGNLGLRSGRHHKDRIADPHCTLLDPAEHDDTLVGIIECVKDQRLKRRFGIAGRRRNLLYDLL